jgi:predicted nucleotidyltransferase component of viral defense system
VIATGVITQRANSERFPAQTIERDYVLAHLCADIGAIGDARLVLKGGTLLRLCYFADYRYSADLDFSAINGLNRSDAIAIIADAAAACRQRIDLPMLNLSDTEDEAPWVMYIGPLGGARPRRIKLDISDTELVETHRRLAIQPRWPDLPEDPAIEGYALDEVGAEKLRCIAERLQCRDLYDLHELLAGSHIDPLETWHLYLRKAANDATRGRQRTPPSEWFTAFERRIAAYRDRWNDELGDYLPDIPPFDGIERRCRRSLLPVITAAQSLGNESPTE